MAVNGNFNGGYTVLDNVALRELASSQAFENAVQNILHVNGKGVNEAFVREGLRGASIAIPWVKLGDGGFRKLGATINGTQYNNKTAVSADSDYFYVPTTFVYDRTETVARIMNDKAGYELLAKKNENIGKKIARGINALTFANQLAACLNASYEGGEALYVEQAASNNKMYDNFIDACAKLGEGDEAIGQDYFETDARQGFFTPVGLGEIKKDDRFIYSDLATEMVATGVLNPFKNDEASKIELRNGFAGIINGVPCYEVTPVLLKLATSYLTTNSLGLAPFAFDDVKGIVVGGEATFRGFSSTGDIEVVPATAGQGWILQPLVYGGCECVSGKSVRPIVANGFTNPVISSATKLVVLPPESTNGQLHVTIGDASTTTNKATVSVTDDAGTTVTGATVYYTIDTDYKKPATSGSEITVTSTKKKATAYATKAGYVASDVAKKTLVYTQ